MNSFLLHFFYLRSAKKKNIMVAIMCQLFLPASLMPVSSHQKWEAQLSIVTYLEVADYLGIQRTVCPH
jgi:hypothetical protein